MKSKNQNLFANVRNIVARGVVCMLLFAVVSCEGAAKPYADDEMEEEVTGDFFTEFSLTETSCEWVRVDFGYELIIINSNEELLNYIICTEVDDFPTIDFSRYTLLLARGFSGNSFTPNYVKLQQLSSGNYEMSIDFPLNLTQVVLHWHVAIITNKLSDSDNVKLNVTFNGKPMNIGIEC